MNDATGAYNINKINETAIIVDGNGHKDHQEEQT